MDFEFEIIRGENQGQVLPLREQTFTVGRVKGNVLVLRDNTVSRQHAKIFKRDGSTFIVDLNSSHGTWVNGKRVTRQELELGDEIRLGQTLLRYQQAGAVVTEEPEEVAPPPPAPAPARAEPEPAATDEEFSLEMPDELMKPSREAEPPAAPPSAAASPTGGLTNQGEDPFADDEDVQRISSPDASPSQQGSGGVGSLYRPTRPGSASSAPFLLQDLDQRSGVVRALAILLAIGLAVGLGYGTLKLISWTTAGGTEEPVVIDEPQGPNRPLAPERR